MNMWLGENENEIYAKRMQDIKHFSVYSYKTLLKKNKFL